MQRYFPRCTAGLLGVLLATQLLAGCVVVPRPYYQPRAIVVEPQPYGGWKDRRDDRGWRYGDRYDRRDRRDWDAGR